MTKNKFFNNFVLCFFSRYNNFMRKLPNIILIVFLCLILVNNQEAQAYINPGSGSYIFQTVIGGILAIIALFKKLFMSLLNLFGIKKSSAEDEPEDE